MATTTNFGWTTPDDTALVKDGASAIRTLGSSIDTSMAQLKGGTTGQVLSKTSNTDMAFTWTAAGISANIVDAKGDIIAGTADNTVSRLAVGANNTVLTADSSTATGLKWASPSAGANWSLVNTGGTSLSGSSTVTVNITAKDKIFILLSGAGSASAGLTAYNIGVRVNGLSTSIYTYSGPYINVGGSYSVNNFSTRANTNDSKVLISEWSGSTTSLTDGWVQISGANASGVKIVDFQTGSTPAGSNGHDLIWGGGIINTSASITSVSIVQLEGANFNAGSVFVYTSD